METRPFQYVVVLLIFLFCCQRNDYRSEGTILGYDARMCACCGGWFIKIDTTTYEFESLPAGSKIDLQNETFPFNVKLDWLLSDRAPCPDKFISITKIIKE
jgi:hypothetical protein